MARKDFYNVEDWAYLAKQAKYDTELLARLLNVCPRQLQRYTRELFNNSPQEWLDERRLVDASILLQGNDLVKTIAYELGFKTVAHFSKKFKIRYGISPMAYKKHVEEWNNSRNRPPTRDFNA
jgi:AraC-like DNA-binding protein